jgi:hypothetical protein
MSRKSFLLGLAIVAAGCAAQSTDPHANCPPSESHSFGYTPPPAEEKERMYQAEPTLFQQEPELAK